MKTLKLALVAAMVAFTMINVTYADGFRTNPKFKMVHNVTLDNAIKNPELVRAMYEQLTLAEVLQVQQHNNPATVIMKGQTYKIYGTADEWRRFFVMDGTHGAKAKSKGPVVE